MLEVEYLSVEVGGKEVFHAIPELDGLVEVVDLCHEAAVGRIAEEEIEYLMARGLSRDEAVAVIVRSFLSVARAYRRSSALKCSAPTS